MCIILKDLVPQQIHIFFEILGECQSKQAAADIFDDDERLVRLDKFENTCLLDQTT